MKRLLTLLTMMLVAYGVQAESMFYFGTLSIKPGETKQIELCLLNEAICEGFQLKLTLPEGLSFIQDEEEEDYVIKVSDRVKKKFNIESNLLPNKSYILWNSSILSSLNSFQIFVQYSSPCSSSLKFSLHCSNTFSSSLHNVFILL